MHFLFDRAWLQARRASFLSLSLGPITDIHPPFPVFATPKNSIKSLTPSDALAKEHYADLSARPFYPSLVKYITSGTPVVAMVWEGKDVIRQGVSFGSFFWFVKGKEKTKPPQAPNRRRHQPARRRCRLGPRPVRRLRRSELDPRL